VLEEIFISTLKKHLRHLGPFEKLGSETSLKELGLDSLEAVALVLDLENKLGVVFGEHSLRAETFVNSAALWKEVHQLMIDKGDSGLRASTRADINAIDS
jgi:acyl carrier protein